MEFGILSLLPPVLAILLALFTRSVIPALFAGVWIGATMVHDWNPLLGMYASFSEFILPNLGDEWSATVLLYCGLFGVLVAFLQKTGGAQAIAQSISKRVKTDRGAQGSTMLFGVIIFFEDYFNALTVGSVMRSVTDKMRVSREKLAYIVDSTSAPLCLLAPVSTWVVFVMGLIGAQFVELGISGSEYVTYLATIPFNFYSILALLLVAIVIFKRWDFGPMAKAEYRARTTGKVLRDGAEPPSDDSMHEFETIPGNPKKRNFLVPIIVLLGMIPPMFLWTGGFPENDLVTAVGEADGGLSILIAAFAAIVVALLMGLQQKLFNFKESMQLIVNGFKSMMLVYIILTLAWSIGSVTQALGTADFIVGLAEQSVSPAMIPILLFIVAGVVAYTTGTSYGTFAIMVPIAMPLAHAMDEMSMFLAIAAVLSGGIFGDHCSPISDTTILSSAGSASDHIDHVNTQTPFAITAGISGLVSFFIAGVTGSALLSLAIGIVVLIVLTYLLQRKWGQKIPDNYSIT
ncbi:Na+/H+ antiporter NhaC family protein [Ornithinibacillus sp. BX22]|uniref:Na+/H+ antiporter NhaC family protein n=1 Tax=Ornithinibacillus hominis TaxID=2763055 RepID=A0A923L778_9BACI|nr:Na+/H+ antiporter NhaC family protein [Ornithinibacillus hominis]